MILKSDVHINDHNCCPTESGAIATGLQLSLVIVTRNRGLGRGPWFDAQLAFVRVPSMPLFEDPGQDVFDGLNLRQLDIDQAYLVVRSTFDQPKWIYSRSDECDQVNLSLLLSTAVFDYVSVTISCLAVQQLMKCISTEVFYE